MKRADRRASPDAPAAPSPVVAKLLRKGTDALGRNDLAGAERALVGVLALAGDHTETLRLKATLAHRRGRLDEAIDTFSDALERSPEDTNLLLGLARVESDRGQLDAAAGHLRCAGELAPDSAAIWFELGKVCDRKGDTEPARAAFAKFLHLRPDHSLARIGLAGTLKSLGRIDEAAAEYRRVIARDPRSHQAWFSLVDLKTVPVTDNETARLAALANDTSLAPLASAALAFALGKVREDTGRHADAFAAFERANAIMRRGSNWNAVRFSGGVDAVIQAFEGLAEPAPAARGHEVIFIVSLPRSGSTLVEQILAAHPEVEGASELPDLSAVIREESARLDVAFPRWVKAATDTDWQRLGQRYLERTARWRSRRPRFTDKMPSNWRMLGAALRMLPGARVIDCRRDVLETCWSCYKQLFAPGRADYAYAFTDLAAYWHDCDRLMRVWRARHADSIRTQSYETLVADAPKQIRQLLAFCNLPFDPACLEFHRAERSTRTASAAQVRQPLQRDTRRTQGYGALLDPLRAALAEQARVAASTHIHEDSSA